MDYLGHLGVGDEEIGDRLGIGRLCLDAQGQRLQPLDELESVERAHSGTDVAQQRDPCFQDIGDRA